MHIQPLAHMLEDLLHEASDGGLEVCLAESPCGSDAEAELDLAALRDEYLHRYQRAVLAVTELRGSALFAGSAGDPGYPDWASATQVSCWSDATGVIYVGLLAENGAMRVIGGGRPHPVEREAITLLPPPS